MRRHEGYDGLDIPYRAAFLRPVQIVRQFISNLETHISRISPYHNYEGLSRALQKAGDREDTPYPYRYNKPYVLHMEAMWL
mgnify:FL=1